MAYFGLWVAAVLRLPGMTLAGIVVSGKVATGGHGRRNPYMFGIFAMMIDASKTSTRQKKSNA